VAVGVRTGEGKVRAGRRMKDVGLGYGRAHRTALEAELKAQLLDRREHRTQRGRSLLITAQLGRAILARGGAAGMAESHVSPLNVGSPAPAGGSCNGGVISPGPFGRVARRCCFSSWRALRLSSFCFFAWR